jgi:acyl-[acyl-carrier-protein]-phospholipid O-acyltransferase/long-chain-fatty-acid--[acyl-carrier-protein] ligase
MSMLTSRRFLPLFITQFIGAFCDNVFKNAFVLLATYGLAAEHGWNPAYAVYLIGGLFILPFVLISGWAGYVSDIWPRHTLVRALKTFEAFVMLGAACALAFDSFYGMWAIIISLGFISALFGPLKYGLLPVYLPTEELVGGNAWFEAGSFIAIVTGTLVGEQATEHPPLGRSHVGALLVVLGLIGCVSTYFLPKAPAAAARTISPWSPRSLRLCSVDAINSIRRVPVLWRSVLGVSWFWCLGAVLLSFLPIYVKDTLHQDAAGVTHFLLYFALGVGFGSFLGMVLSHGKIRATYVPLAGLAISGFLFLWVFADRFGATHLGLYLTVITLGIGTAGGIYSVPLYALMQHRSPADQRGRVISANNIMNAIFMVAGALGAVGIAAIDPRPSALLSVLGAANFIVSLYMVWLIPESVLQTVVRLFLRIVFRVRVRGIESFPASGPRLVIANHTSWLDAALLAAFLPEPPVFAVDSRIARLPWVRPFLKWTTAYAIDPMHPISLKTLCGAVSEGGVVAIFPEGRLTTTGGLMKVYDGAGFIAQKTGARIVTVHIDGAQLSLLTRLGGKYRRQWFPRITLTVGEPVVMPASIDRRGRSPFMYSLLSESAYRSQSADHSLYRELIEASRKHRGGVPMWVGHDGRTASYSQILGRSAYLGTRLAAETLPGEVVGLMMPTSMGGGLAFWGLQFAHRVPAWINFSMGGEALLSTLRTAGVRTVVTSRAFVAEARLTEKAEAMARAGARIVYLEDLRPTLAWKARAAWIALNVRSAYASSEAAWKAAGAFPCEPALERRAAARPDRLLAQRLRLQRAPALPRLRIHGRHADAALLRGAHGALPDPPALRHHPGVHLQL